MTKTELAQQLALQYLASALNCKDLSPEAYYKEYKSTYIRFYKCLEADEPCGDWTFSFS